MNNTILVLDNPKQMEPVVSTPQAQKLGIYPFLVLAALLVIFFPDIFLKGHVLIGKMSDLHLVNYSLASYFKDQMRSGIFPLWNTLAFSGYPYGADGYSPISFLNFLTWCLNDVNLAWNTVILLSIYLAGVFGYLYLKKIGASDSGSLIAVIIFAFAPASAHYLDSWGFFLPLTLWLSESYFASRCTSYLVAMICALTFLFLNALPQYSIYAAIFVSLYWIFRFRSLLVFAALGLSTGLAAVYIFPLLEALPLSPRGNLWFMNVLLPTHFITLVFPNFFESPFRPEANFLFAKGFALVANFLFRSQSLQILYPPNIGILGISFLFLGWKQRGAASFHRGVILFVLFYLMTFPLLATLYRKIPLLAQLPRTERLNPIFTFSMTVLAAWGCDRVMNRISPLRPLAMFYLVLSSLVTAILFAVRLFVSFHSDTLKRMAADYLKKNVIENPAYAAPPEFYTKRIDEFVSLIYSWTNVFNPSVLLPLGFIIATLFLFYLWNQNKIGRAAFSTAAVLLTALDLLIAFKGMGYQGTPAYELKPKSQAVDFMKRDGGIFRVMTILDPVGFGGARSRDILAPNANILYGLAGVEGYDPIFPGRYSIFFKNFQTNYEKDPAMILGGPETGFDYRMLDFLNVKYFFTSAGLAINRDLPLVFHDSKNRIYFNKHYFPRAFIVHSFKVIPNREEALAYFRSPQMAFDREVVLEEQPEAQFEDTQPADEDRALIRNYSSNDIEIDVQASAPGFLVLSDNFYPGWAVSVDGKPSKIYRANLSFRAVPITRGTHLVRFSFSPVSLKWGIGVSAASMLLLTLFSVLHYNKFVANRSKTYGTSV